MYRLHRGPSDREPDRYAGIGDVRTGLHRVLIPKGKEGSGGDGLCTGINKTRDQVTCKPGTARKDNRYLNGVDNGLAKADVEPGPSAIARDRIDEDLASTTVGHFARHLHRAAIFDRACAVDGDASGSVASVHAVEPHDDALASEY